MELTAAETQFYKNESGFLGMKHNETDYPRINIVKCFPLSHNDIFLSVCDHETKEIGLIPDAKLFPEETRAFFNEELDRRYFLPEITSMNSLRQEFGYVYWNVNTTSGTKKFITSKDGQAIVDLKDDRYMIVDLDGNRYNIIDYTKLDNKSFRMLQLIL